MIENKGEMQLHITDIRGYIDPTAARLLNRRLQCSRPPTVAVASKPGKAVGRAVGNLISRRLCALRSKYNHAGGDRTPPLARDDTLATDTCNSRKKSSLPSSLLPEEMDARRIKDFSRRIPRSSFRPFQLPVVFKRGNTNLP